MFYCKDYRTNTRPRSRVWSRIRMQERTVGIQLCLMLSLMPGSLILNADKCQQRQPHARALGAGCNTAVPTLAFAVLQTSDKRDCRSAVRKPRMIIVLGMQEHEA